MLHYVSYGPRPFGSKAFSPIRRARWEFFVAVKGDVAPVASLHEAPTFDGANFWIFPPGHLHGWRGQPRKRCRVAVFQYDRVPPVLERLVKRAGLLALHAPSVDRRRCDAFARELIPHVWTESDFKDILAERVLLDLTLLILQIIDAAAGKSPKANQALLRVQAAEKRFQAELRLNPPLGHLAVAAGVSEAHLRRLFRQVRGRSPSEVMREIRMQAALRLLPAADQKLENIALECGFGSASNFCQAFKQLKGVTPGAWRKRHAAVRSRR